MDEDREPSTPLWPGRETIGHGYQRSAEHSSSSSSLNGPGQSIPVPDKDSARNAIIEVRSEPAITQQRPWSSSPPPASRDNGARAAEDDADSSDAKDASPAQDTAADADASAHAPEERGDESEMIVRSFGHAESFSEPAARCIAKAGWIAYVLNHTSINAAHLILAMSLDERAAKGLEDRGFDVQELRRAMLPLLIGAKWRYSEEDDNPKPVISMTSDVADILEAAKRRAGERDNQPATLPDLWDTLSAVHAKGKLVPAAPEERRTDIRAELESALTVKFDEFKRLLDQGFAWSANRLDEAMARATGELLATLNSKPPANDGPIETPPDVTPEGPQEPEAPDWRSKLPFRLAILGLL